MVKLSNLENLQALDASSLHLNYTGGIVAGFLMEVESDSEAELVIENWPDRLEGIQVNDKEETFNPDIVTYTIQNTTLYVSFHNLTQFSPYVSIRLIPYYVD